jgi:hypothetical protein
MGKNLMKIIGMAQGAVGALGTAAPAAIGTAIQTTQGGSIFNLLSGAALSYLGLKGSAGMQNVGIPTVSGLNGLVGILGLLGPNNPLQSIIHNGTGGSLINIGIAVVGFIATFMKGKTAAK